MVYEWTLQASMELVECSGWREATSTSTTALPTCHRKLLHYCTLLSHHIAPIIASLHKLGLLKPTSASKLALTHLSLKMSSRGKVLPPPHLQGGVACHCVIVKCSLVFQCFLVNCFSRTAFV